MKKLLFSLLLITSLSYGQTYTYLKTTATPITINDTTQVELVAREKAGANKGMYRKISWSYLASIFGGSGGSQNLHSVLTVGNTSDLPIRLIDDDSEVIYYQAGFAYTDVPTNKRTTIGFDTPTHNNKYFIPAKPGNDTFAMLSDLVGLGGNLQSVTSGTGNNITKNALIVRYPSEPNLFQTNYGPNGFTYTQNAPYSSGYYTFVGFKSDVFAQNYFIDFPLAGSSETHATLVKSVSVNGTEPVEADLYGNVDLHVDSVNLQGVTDSGNITTNNLRVYDADFFTLIKPQSVSVNGNLYKQLLSDTALRFDNLTTGNSTTVGYNEPTGTNLIYFPNASGTISLVGSETLQSVTDNGNSTLNDIKVGFAGVRDIIQNNWQMIGGDDGGITFGDAVTPADNYFSVHEDNMAFGRSSLNSKVTFTNSTLTANRTLAAPDQSGTIALKENVIPYNGATESADMGSWDFNARNLSANNHTIADNNGTVIGNDVKVHNATTGYDTTLKSTNNTAGRTLTMPNANGTAVISINGTTPDTNGNITLAMGGTGTVTLVTGTNGVTVATGTTTPVIGLGNITPTSINASGTVVGSNLAGTNTGNEVQATETVKGIAEIATQTETNTGTDDLRMITPLKLATYGAATFEPKYSTGATGIPLYASGVLSWIAGTSTQYIKGGGTLGTFATDVRGTVLSGFVSTPGTITTGTQIQTAIGYLDANQKQMTAVASKSAAYTLTLTDYYVKLTTGSFTFTLPTAVGASGKQYVVKNTGAGTLTLATTSSQTIDGTTTKTFNTQYSGCRVISDGANWDIIGTY